MRAQRDPRSRYLPIRCPSCNFMGKAAILRLDETFVCRKCRKPFHINRDEVVPGPRPEAPADDPWAELLLAERPSRFQRALQRLPRVAWWAAAGGVLVAALTWFTQSPQPVELPEALIDRAVLLLEAKRRQDLDTVLALTPRAQRSNARDWFNSRPTHWGIPPAPDETLNGRGEVRFRNEKDGAAGVLVTLQRPPPEGTTEALTYWLRNAAGLWEFDAERTNRESQ